MNFRQCALIFEKYPTEHSWIHFFNYHQPFWDYITQTAKELFPVNIVYPVKITDDWNFEQYQLQDGLNSLEDFFALYFLLIMYQHNHLVDEKNFSRDQELWKHLWDRECWSQRVKEEMLVLTLNKLKFQLHQHDLASLIQSTKNLEVRN